MLTAASASTIIEFSVRNTPNWRPVAPNGVDPCQGGMDAVRELGGCLAVATVVMEDLRDRGITIDEYGSHGLLPGRRVGLLRDHR